MGGCVVCFESQPGGLVSWWISHVAASIDTNLGKILGNICLHEAVGHLRQCLGMEEWVHLHKVLNNTSSRSSLGDPHEARVGAKVGKATRIGNEHGEDSKRRKDAAKKKGN